MNLSLLKKPEELSLDCSFQESTNQDIKRLQRENIELNKKCAILENNIVRIKVK